MSWAEVKKINSDLTVSLDLLTIIQNMNLVGLQVTPIFDINLMMKLINTSSLYNYPIALGVVGNAYWNYISGLTSGAGGVVGNTFGITNTAITSAGTLSGILAQAQGPFELGNNPLAVSTIVQNKSIFATIGGSQNAAFLKGVYYNTNSCQRLMKLANNIETAPMEVIRTTTNMFNSMNSATKFTANGTYTVPTGAVNLFVTAIAGGGGGTYGQYLTSGRSGNGGSVGLILGGRGQYAGDIASGLGGASGAIGCASINVQGVSTIAYSPGAGGGTGTTAGDGGSTVFGGYQNGFSPVDKRSQKFIFEISSNPGQGSSITGLAGGNASGIGGAGGWGGGSGAGGTGSSGGSGGGTYGTGGGGGGGTSSDTYYSIGGGGGGGYGGGGGGGYSTNTSARSGGSGGGGIIVVRVGLPFNLI